MLSRNLKFERRFRLVEQKLKAQGKSVEQSSFAGNGCAMG